MLPATTEPIEKRCSVCGVLQPIARFPLRAKSKKPAAHCKNCANKWNYASKSRRPNLIDPDVQEKECCNCHQVLPLSEFYRHKAMKHGVVPRCKACRREQKLAYDKAHPVMIKKAYLKNTYGITQDDFNALFAKQGGGCAICGTPGKLHVDHKHDETKRVRSLLCFACNTLIGLAKEDIHILESAAAYLFREEHPENANKEIVARFVFELKELDTCDTLSISLEHNQGD